MQREPRICICWRGDWQRLEAEQREEEKVDGVSKKRYFVD